MLPSPIPAPCWSHILTLYRSTRKPSTLVGLVDSPSPQEPIYLQGQAQTLSTSICDLQEKFRPAIHEYPRVISTTQKLLRAASILKIPVFATTQQRAKLGETCPELGLDTTHPTAAHVDKSAFSMWVPEIEEALKALPQQPVDTSKDTTVKKRPFDVIVVGIETHICVLQTSLDMLAMGHRVWVVQDAVSSCNREEREVALQRLRQEGAKVTTSESLIYEIIGDAKDEG